MFLLRKALADPNNAAGAAAATADAAHGYPRDPNGDRLICAGGSNVPGDAGSGDGGGNYGSAPATPLMLAAKTGLENVVQELLARGARVDARGGANGWTALHYGAARGHALVMKSLLTAPLADPGVRTARLETPLTIACSHGHLAIADMLLGDDNSDRDSNATGIGGGDGSGAKQTKEVAEGNATAAEVQKSEMFGFPMAGMKSRRGARRHAEEKTWAGRTPLHEAAANGHTELVLRLLAHGVSADVVDTGGATPLILAARRGHASAAAPLVTSGTATLQATTTEGDTALHAAAGTAVDGASVVVRALLRSDADVDVRNRAGSTRELIVQLFLLSLLSLRIQGTCYALFDTFICCAYAAARFKPGTACTARLRPTKRYTSFGAAQTSHIDARICGQ